MQDPDDIIREIDTKNRKEVDDEIVRLWQRKRVALQGHYTRKRNILKRLMISAMFGRTDPNDEGQFDHTTTMREQLHEAKTKLDFTYSKLGHLYDRVNELNPENAEHEDSKALAKTIAKTETDFDEMEIQYGTLRYKLIQQQPPKAPQTEATNTTVKPMTALEPEILSFDNNPIEMNSWLTSYRAYSRASKFQNLTIEEQHAFIKKRMTIEVWQSILQNMSLDTPVFHEDEQHNATNLNTTQNNASAFLEISVFDLIHEAFQIKYPLITRRYEFFNSKRQGNQSFTDWFSKLKEMQFSAAISEMRPDEILIMRICTGIEDQDVLDRILQIPNEDFKLEEVQRLCVRAESAKNFQKQMKPQSQQSYYTGKTNYQKAKLQEWKEKHAPKQETNNDTNNDTDKHFDRLKKDNRCFRCGKTRHEAMSQCKATNAICRRCSRRGHFDQVCGASTGAIPKTPKQNTRHTANYINTKEKEQTSDSDSE